MRAKGWLIGRVVMGGAILAGGPLMWGQSMPATTAPSTSVAAATAVADPMIAKIREEGMQRSEVMQTLNYLSNAIGPRLTGSPNLKRANEWTRDQLTKLGLENAHLEQWPFGGRGWQVKRFTMQVIEPLQISLIAYPKAWSPGLENPISAEVALLEARTEEDLQKYRGKLKGKVVLDGGTRAIGPSFTPLAARLSDSDLERFSKATPGGNIDTQPRIATTGPATRGAGAGRGRGIGAGGGLARGRVIQFLMEEGAVMELTMTTGNQMAILVGAGAVTLPTTAGAATASAPATATAPAGAPGRGRGGPAAYAPNAPATLPQVTVTVEGYNRLVRMAQLGVPLKIEADLQERTVQHIMEYLILPISEAFQI